MAALQESWLQDVAKMNNLPALRPAVVKALLPVVELQLRKVIQEAHKFSRRGKGNKLTIEDVNQTLELHRFEPLYGFVDHRQLLSSNFTSSLNSGGIVSLTQVARAPLPKCPLAPELSLHWLAVDGEQPVIPENPSQSAAVDAGDNPSTLPRELQQFYMRVTGVLLSAESGDRTLRAVLTALREDSGLQDLVPYFSKFIYHHVKANARSLQLLRTLMAAVHALISNPALRVEFHLQQLLPALFTAIVQPKLSSSALEDHWALRAQASTVVAYACVKYSPLLTHLQARVCKTYLEALQPDRAIATLCGGLMGLSALGHAVVRALLLPKVRSIGERLTLTLQSGGKHKSRGDGSSGGKDKLARESLGAEMCLAAIAHAMGSYLAHSIRVGVKPSMQAEGAAPDDLGDEANDQRPAKKLRGAGLEGIESSDVAGLEEALVPYFASVAPEAAHCRVLF